jgi:hypothetical protein
MDPKLVSNCAYAEQGFQTPVLSETHARYSWKAQFDFFRSKRQLRLADMFSLSSPIQNIVNIHFAVVELMRTDGRTDGQILSCPQDVKAHTYWSCGD